MRTEKEIKAELEFRKKVKPRTVTEFRTNNNFIYMLSWVLGETELRRGKPKSTLKIFKQKV